MQNLVALDNSYLVAFSFFLGGGVRNSRSCRILNLDRRVDVINLGDVMFCWKKNYTILH